MKPSVTQPNLITAIDIGTTKICVLIAQRGDDGSLHIVGMGHAPSAGLARGVVVSIAPAVTAIQHALREAELMAGYKVNEAYIGISGGHIRSFNSQGMVAIKQGDIKASDITNAVNASKAVSLPEGQQLLHAIPQFFTINGNEIVRDPLGMYGVRLEVQSHIITGAVASVQNLIRCCELAGITARDIILEPIASAAAVLSADEQELGAGLLDIGGGTSDFAIYHKNALRHTHIIPLAGTVFTNDIAVCLHTSLHDAERIKKEFGIADRRLLVHDQAINVVNAAGDQATIMQSNLLEVLAPRAQELLLLVAEEVERQRLRPFMPAGLVITGGGSLLYGLKELAQSIMRMPVRIGRPLIPATTTAVLDNPIYATAYGLIVHTATILRATEQSFGNEHLSNRVFTRMKSWICDLF